MLALLGSSFQRSAATAFAAVVTAAHSDGDGDHLPLTVVGLAAGQTARISVTNSPNPASSDPTAAIVVEMMFHDERGSVITDRYGRPVRRELTIEPHRAASLELNGNLVAPSGGRVTIIPCIRVVSGGDGSLAVPTFEMYNNLLRATTILSAGALRGFDPQPDPPAPAEVAFGASALTRGLTARLHVLSDRASVEPVTLELEFHDNEGQVFGERAGEPTRRIVTLEPGQAASLDVNGNDIAGLGSRVGIVPCVKVLRSSPGVHVSMALETFVNATQQTFTLANWQALPTRLAPR
jgi:hypothetical protein